MAENWLKTYRKRLRITQEELCARLQVLGIDTAPATISHWETERYKPPLHDIDFRNGLANALKVSPQEMLRAAGYETDQKHSNAGERAASIVDKLPAHQQKIALGILEQFIEEV